MELKIILARPEFSIKPECKDKLMVQVEFPNCISSKTNKPFRWLPTYRELEDLKVSLEAIEKITWKKEGGMNDERTI